MLAGVACGLVGLVSVPLFAVCVAWIVAAWAASGRRGRGAAAVVAAAALGTFALWAAPVLSNFVRFGGFVDITLRLGVEWPLSTAFGAWGMLLPAAAAGVVLAAARRMDNAGPLLAFAGATVALLALAVARRELGWDLGGNATVLHQGRLWPTGHLLGAAFAGVAIAHAYRWLRARFRRVAAATVGAVFLVGAASPTLASAALTSQLAANESSAFVFDGGDFSTSSFVRRAARVLDPTDVVRVEGDEDLGMFLYQFSGARLAAFDEPRLEHNDLRIRYADLAHAWDRKIAAGGFDADFLAVPEAVAPPGGAVVARGLYRGQSWVLVPHVE